MHSKANMSLNSNAFYHIHFNFSPFDPLIQDIIHMLQSPLFEKQIKSLASKLNP